MVEDFVIIIFSVFAIMVCCNNIHKNIDICITEGENRIIEILLVIGFLIFSCLAGLYGLFDMFIF